MAEPPGQPDATVDLAGGRQRASSCRGGAERERLWAKFREYPGWGDDIGGLAAHRPGQTAVVVLEPRDDPHADFELTTSGGPTAAGW